MQRPRRRTRVKERSPYCYLYFCETKINACTVDVMDYNFRAK
jgi:hypothetical protein